MNPDNSLQKRDDGDDTAILPLGSENDSGFVIISHGGPRANEGIAAGAFLRWSAIMRYG